MIDISFVNMVKKRRGELLLIILLYFHLSVLAAIDGSLERTRADPNDVICIDRDPACKEFSREAKCRRADFVNFMSANCPASCNLCNPNLEKWVPRDVVDGGRIQTKLAAEYIKKNVIYHGVAQKADFDFSGSSFVEASPISMVDGSIQRNAYYNLRINDVLEAMNVYLEDIYSDKVDGSQDKERVYYSPLDVDGSPDGARLPFPETCINRHPYCALWAVLGYCDIHKQLMSQWCKPMCQMCDTISKRGDDIYFEENTSMRQSPFRRNDVNGIFENIIRNKVIVDVPLSQKQIPPNMKIEKHENDVKFLNLRSINFERILLPRTELNQKMYANELDSNGTAPLFSTILQMNNFLTEQECRGLLDTVAFGVGVKNVAGTGDDGFPARTNTTNGDKSILLRNNSRVEIYPSIQDKLGRMTFSNAIERLLLKIGLLTGLNAAETVETPIVFEKFEMGDFNTPTSHFKSAVWMDSKTYGSNNVNSSDIEQYYDQSDIPDRMENARTFAVVIFLNGSGNNDEGGSIYFPNVENVEIFPSVGNAVLLPTSARFVRQDIEGTTSRSLDKHYHHGKGDGTNYVEDRYTKFGHKALQKERTKYCITLYFRRYEDKTRVSP